MFFKYIFQSIRRLVSGKTIKRIDTPIPAGGSSFKISLWLKTDNETPYVVLALLASGNRQYCVMEMDEFHSFFGAMAEIRSTASGLQKPGLPGKR